MDLVIATKNNNKLIEIKSKFSTLQNLNIISLKEIGPTPEIIEDGNSFEENAQKKALGISKYTNFPVMADDSGLVIDALDGRPGIYSARYGGKEITNSKRNQLILEEMQGIKMENRKALVVDDEFHIVQVVSIKLKNNGFDVVTAENGSDGYELASQTLPDIIVSDYQMPVMSGVEMIEKLRQNPETAHIPVIMLTARGFSIEAEQKEQLHISACLSKPFSPREVLQTIEDVLKQDATV